MTLPPIPQPSRLVVKLALVVVAFAALKLYDEYQKEQFTLALKNLKKPKKGKNVEPPANSDQSPSNNAAVDSGLSGDTPSEI